jgi:hypothetical protein
VSRVSTAGGALKGSREGPSRSRPFCPLRGYDGKSLQHRPHSRESGISEVRGFRTVLLASGREAGSNSVTSVLPSKRLESGQTWLQRLRAQSPGEAALRNNGPKRQPYGPAKAPRLASCRVARTDLGRLPERPACWSPRRALHPRRRGEGKQHPTGALAKESPHVRDASWSQNRIARFQPQLRFADLHQGLTNNNLT